MCGICGFTGAANPHVLGRMSDSMVHRGPDEDGTFADGHINLGIRRLSITDVHMGQQPISNEDESIWVVMNGEIYNHRAIRQDLEKRAHRFRTDHCDTEVIVHLYEERGDDFVHALNGMFAIALWDSSRKRLLLVRDRMGVKPLFYADVDGNLIFASEIKALLVYPGCPKELNSAALYHYFTFKNVPSPMTAFRGIRSLSPGGMMASSGAGASNRRWWKISFEPAKACDEMAARETIHGLLEDATRLRMVSDVPVGAYLSGGVDSSAVVALMSKYSDRPVRTFCLGYEDELKNKEADLYFARKVSKAYGTDHHEYVMSWKELAADATDVIGAFDQPFSGTISTYFLSKLIRKHVKVALSGDGADEIFGSYLSHRVAQPMARYLRFRDAVIGKTLTEGQLAMFRPCDTGFLEDLYSRSGGDEILWRYHLCLFLDEEKNSLLTREFRDRTDEASSLSLLAESYRSLTACDPLNRVLEMEWNTQLPDQVLAFVDFLSMAHSVEVRSPFLDFRLVEFMATLPGSLKIRDGNVKDILKRSVGRLLPDGITERPKEGFVLPVYDWLEAPLKGFCREVLSEQAVRKHRVLEPEAVRQLVDGYYAGNRRNAGKVWNLMMVQIWLDRYFG